MKKIILHTMILSGLFVGSALTVSAQYAYQYNLTDNTYIPANYANTNSY